VREALRLAFPSTIVSGRRLVMALEGYFDESGTHGGSSTFSLAGYVSTPERWATFETEWRAALADFGLEFWHMASFANRVGEYGQWTEDVRRERFARLASIIQKHAVYSIGTVFSMADYETSIPFRVRKFFGGPYGAAAASTFFTGGEYARKNDAWMAYVFESGAQGAGQVLHLFEANQRDPKEQEYFRLLSLRFENKRQFVPLQAADMLAYELYRHLPTVLGADPRPARWFHLAPLETEPRSWGHLAIDQLKTYGWMMTRSVFLAADRTIRPKRRSGKRKRR
jgi:hypothetical protein